MSVGLAEVLAAVALLVALGWWTFTLTKKKSELRDEEWRLAQERNKWQKKVEEDKIALETMAREKSVGFPWLAQAYADYYHLQDERTAEALAHKWHPAKKAAEQVREIAVKRRDAEKLWRVLKYQLEYYETLFPWLSEFKGEDLDDLVKQISEKKEMLQEEAGDNDDPARHWLTKAEYEQLPSVEKYQRALERYWTKKKSKWEIGRDYERYVGYLYEMKGYGVTYHGIVEGLADLGRDLIAKKGGTVEIVQCKNWSTQRIIHEKHVFQLFGTKIAYQIDNPGAKIRAAFFTSTVLSERAERFARQLDIDVHEQFPLKRYPSVKCNISKRDGTKIYHLPFDQQYDRTTIEQAKLESYVEMVKEAEALGFRRAFRWRGQAV